VIGPCHDVPEHADDRHPPVAGARARRDLAGGIRTAAVTVRFATELLAIAMVTVAAHRTIPWPFRLAATVAAPVLLAAVWARWLAPRAPGRLEPDDRVLIGSGSLLLAAACWGVADDVLLAAVFGVVVAVDTVLLLLLDG
jgi:hypothetical protein